MAQRAAARLCGQSYASAPAAVLSYRTGMIGRSAPRPRWDSARGRRRAAAYFVRRDDAAIPNMSGSGRLGRTRADQKKDIDEAYSPWIDHPNSPATVDLNDTDL